MVSREVTVSDRLSIRVSPDVAADLAAVDDRRAYVERLVRDRSVYVAALVTHLATELGGVAELAESVRWLLRLDTTTVDDCARLHPHLDRSSHDALWRLVDEARAGNGAVWRHLGGAR